MTRSGHASWRFSFSLLAILSTLAVEPTMAQMQSSSAYTTTSDLRDVRPFRAWVTDATFTPGVDIEPILAFSDFGSGSAIDAGARAAVWVNDGIEAGGSWGFASVDPKGGESTNGLQDIGLYVRYRLPLDVEPTVAIGSEITLPVGDEDIGQSNLDIRFFGALRYDVNGSVTLISHVGIESIERFDDREAGLMLGGGLLIPMTEELALISELNITTAAKDTSFLGGVDFELPPGGHLRAGLALGLDDGAPDLELVLGFAIPVY